MINHGIDYYAVHIKNLSRGDRIYVLSSAWIRQALRRALTVSGIVSEVSLYEFHDLLLGQSIQVMESRAPWPDRICGWMFFSTGRTTAGFDLQKPRGRAPGQFDIQGSLAKMVGLLFREISSIPTPLILRILP